MRHLVLLLFLIVLLASAVDPKQKATKNSDLDRKDPGNPYWAYDDLLDPIISAGEEEDDDVDDEVFEGPWW